MSGSTMNNSTVSRSTIWSMSLIVVAIVAGCCWNYPGYRPSTVAVTYKTSTSIPASWRTPIEDAGDEWVLFVNTGLTGSNVGIDGARTVGTAFYPDPRTLAAAWPLDIGGASGCDVIEQDIGFSPIHNWSTQSTTPAGAVDVESVALHEFGHWNILFHVICPSNSVMLSSYQGTRRSLSGCDSLGKLVATGSSTCNGSIGACFGFGYFFFLFGFGDSLESNELNVVNHTNELLQIISGDPALASTLDQLAANAPPPGAPPDPSDLGLALQAVSQARVSASPGLRAALNQIDYLIDDYINTLIGGGF